MQREKAVHKDFFAAMISATGTNFLQSIRVLIKTLHAKIVAGKKAIMMREGKIQQSFSSPKPKKITSYKHNQTKSHCGSIIFFEELLDFECSNFFDHNPSQMVSKTVRKKLKN